MAEEELREVNIQKAEMISLQNISNVAIPVIFEQQELKLQKNGILINRKSNTASDSDIRIPTLKKVALNRYSYDRSRFAESKTIFTEKCIPAREFHS